MWGKKTVSCGNFFCFNNFQINIVLVKLNETSFFWWGIATQKHQKKRKMAAAQSAAAGLIGSAKVVIFSWVRCPYCVKAKNLLSSMTKDLNVVQLDTMGLDGEKIHHEVIQMTNHDTVPAIFIRGKFIGGFTDVDALNKRGELEALMS